MITKIKKKIFAVLFVCITALCTVSFGFGAYKATAASKEKSDITIFVDTLSYESDYLPNGVVGKTYPVFDFKAVDGNGDVVGDSEVLVTAPGGQFVPINDSRFRTDEVGRYTITYKASKGADETKVELYVDVIAESEYVAPHGEISADLVDSAKTGNKVILPAFLPEDGLGEVLVERTITYSGDYSCEDVVVEYYGRGEFFIPSVSGEYKIEYFMSDIVGTEQTVSKTVSVTDSARPFLNTPSVSLIGFVGETITFERAEAFVFVNGLKIFIPVKTLINETDITESMTYVPTQEGTLNIRYVAENVFSQEQDNTATYEAVIKVKDPKQNATGVPYIDNFLYLDGFTGAWIKEPEDAEAKVQGVEYDVYTLTANEQQSVASWQFKSAIPVQYANVKFGFNTIYSGFENVVLHFTDGNNADKLVEVCLKKGADNQTDVYVNGVRECGIPNTFSNPSAIIKDSTFSFSIDSETGVLLETTSNTEITTITTYKNGDKFDSFPSGKVFLSMTLEGIVSRSDLKIYEIATQNIANQVTDRNKPIFIQPKDFSRVYHLSINEAFTIASLSAFDLYDENVQISVSVVAPNQEEIYSGALTENCVFTPDKYGKYTIYYRAVDSSNNSRELQCVVNVVDRTAPTISVVDIPDKVKVGEEIKLPSASVSDNYTENLTTWIYVTYGNFQRLTLLENTFKFEEAGTYLIKYGVEDDMGNYTVVTYTVICEE